jgi:hypothetical protein
MTPIFFGTLSVDIMEWTLMWKKTKMVSISRRPSPEQIMTDKNKTLRMWNISTVRVA